MLRPMEWIRRPSLGETVGQTVCLPARLRLHHRLPRAMAETAQLSLLLLTTRLARLMGHDLKRSSVTATKVGPPVCLPERSRELFPLRRVGSKDLRRRLSSSRWVN